MPGPGDVRECPAIVDRAPLCCPACRHRFTGEWKRWPGENWRTRHSQTCPACGHRWPTAWPGFAAALAEGDGARDLTVSNADMRPVRPDDETVAL